jgi:hypothetical protein
METQTRSPDVAATESSAIELRIAGADLLLAGRFLHWTPVTLIHGKGDEGLAQVLVDVTSNRTAPKRTSRTGRPLFEFRAKSVKAAGRQTYRMTGAMKVTTAEGTESGEVSAVLESPQGHTPFFAITFTIDKAKFAGLWSAFEERAAHAIASGQDELRPWAWLREPVLAAA